MTNRSIASLLSFSIATLASLGPLRAADFISPEWAGNSGASISVWESFTNALGEPGNPPESTTNSAGGSVLQSAPGATITGSGNIYNPAGASSFSLIHESTTTYQTLSLQTKIIGAIDPESVALDYQIDGELVSLPAEMIEISREAGGFGDTIVNQWTWDLKALPLSSLVLRFASTGPHASLDAVRLDVLSTVAPKPLVFELLSWTAQENTTYTEWLNFTEAFGKPGNRPDIEGSNPESRLVQSVPGTSVTGSGNIYNPAGTSSFALNVSDDHPYDQISVQAKITGRIATDSVALSYTDNETVKTLTTETVEVGRESGPQGDTIIYHWAWDTTDLDVTNFVVRFNAVAPHASLVSVRLNTLQQQSDGRETITANFTEPLHDRWNYPFNATPGTRARASIFRALDPEQGVDRHGTFIMLFDTSEQIPSGRPEADYKIVSAQLRVLTSDNFDVPYDPSPDSITSHLPGEHSDHTADDDPGRPIHVFGAGFRHGLDPGTWNEISPYVPENETERSVFPAIVDESGEIVDVTLAVDYADPKDAVPFATGSLSETAPGDLIPSDTWMQFEVDLSTASTMKYLQQNLSQGILAFSLTSLNGGGQGIRTFPEFHTSDTLIGEAPQLTLSVELVDSVGTIELPIISGIRTDEAGIHIGINAKGASQLGIRWTQDFITWTEINNPIIATEADGSLSWTDTTVTDSRFYQLIQKP